MSNLSASDWDIVEEGKFPTEFESTKGFSWEPAKQLASAAEAVLGEVAAHAEDLLTQSDYRLRDLGPDPSRTDWDSFRPLRLTREEDWSNWLAWLLESSSSGSFLQRILIAAGLEADDTEIEKVSVEREVPVGKGKSVRKADLLATWGQPQQRLHIEVKIDDENRKKTLPTAKLLEKKFGRCRHCILLRDEHVHLWEDELGRLQRTEKSQDTTAIPPFTWNDVAVALRSLLANANENIRWRSFAHAFLGAIEQKILDHPVVGVGNSFSPTILDFGPLLSMVEVLERSGTKK